MASVTMYLLFTFVSNGGYNPCAGRGGEGRFVQITSDTGRRLAVGRPEFPHHRIKERT